MFYKIPLNCDISNISYRCCKIIDDFIYIDYNDGIIPNPCEEVSEDYIRIIAPEWFEKVVEPTQLDRIEKYVSISNEELRQEGADILTESLIASGII